MRKHSATFQRWGVRARVTMAASLVLTGILVLGASLLVSLVNQSLQASLDTAALTRAQDVAASVVTNGVRSNIPTSTGDGSLVQIVDATGKVVASSENVSGELPILASFPSSRTTVTLTLTNVPVASSSQMFRVIAEPVQLPSGGGWVYVANSLEQVDSAIGSLVLLLSIGLPVMVLIVGSAVWFTVGRALRPVELIRRRAVEIRADFTQRVPVPASNDEIGRLAKTMNEMLDRLAVAAEQERRFVGDASHELRSPLAAIRSQVDVALEHPYSSDPQRVFRTIQNQTVQMTHLLGDLLFLARVSEQPAGHSSVDVDEVVMQEFYRLHSSAGALIVRLSHLDAARISGSTRDLARLAANLGDNAAHYAHSEITIGLFAAAPGFVEIVVTDDGPGIPLADRKRIFDRFTRLDHSRSRSETAPGTGLGLAIAQQIAIRHGGTIVATERTDGMSGAVLTARLSRTS